MRLREVKMGGKRSIISLIIVCLIGCMLCGCDKKQDTEKEIGKNAPKIVVGSDNYPPFNYMDENGNPTGIDVDIATEAFKRLGYRVEFVNIEWEDKKNLVENGDIDCIWGCFQSKDVRTIISGQNRIWSADKWWRSIKAVIYIL